ncbi:trypsin-like peptidase domain-containing protein [Azospira sp. APE16]|uniref:trypsin-like peptidase domain-containing protein n=1 Tax=Azospira sp. APE16 TaxID=3394231 RepID=UPI003A4D7294
MTHTAPLRHALWLAFFAMASAAANGDAVLTPGQPQSAAPSPSPGTAGQSGLAMRVAERLPSVVQIRVRRSEGVAAVAAANTAPGLPVPDGTGSGFVFDSQGHLLTNAHVVRRARQILVIAPNGQEVEAKVVGSDDTTDIAVLKTAAPLAPPVPLGSSKELRPGDPVFAVGSPFGLAHSVSAGIVSASGRFLPSNPHVAFLQTDAAINPGNSGGPLFDAEGRLVGINSMSFSRSGGYTNIGFAIPVEEARRVAAILIRDGQVKRGWLGAELQATETAARALGRQRGVLVTRVHADTPAEKAGLQAGDLVIGIAGRPLADGGDLHRFLAAAAPGDRLELELWRQQQSRSVRVVLGEKREVPRPATNLAAYDPARSLGLVLQELPAKGGLRILAVQGIAEQNGLDPGDEIDSLDGQPVKEIHDLNLALGRIPNREMGLLGIRRQGRALVLPLGPRPQVGTTSTTAPGQPRSTTDD